MLRLKDVSFAYDKDPVLKYISLAIGKGEFVGILGPNGSGKSTLLKMMGGILRAGTGQISFRETDIDHYKRKILARSVAWIPQEHPQVFPFRVQEIVLMGRHPYLSPLTFEKEEDYGIADRAMKITETSHLAARRFNEVSGGEKQRVMIASAIAQEPEIMILDEPTTALDIKYQLEILNILKRLNLKKSMTLVLAMHDLHLASKFCRRLILLNQGRIIKDGTPGEVLQREILEEVYGVKIKLFRDQDDGSFLISSVT
ncbi:MAG: ABC transporter ATP-binding protein [Nitrospinaceae bacterium]